MRALLLLGFGMFALGCAPKDGDVRLGRLAAQRRSLEATFDHLEDRLVVNQARVRFWREMRARHESVSAIACASQEEHAEEMALHGLPTTRSSMHHSRVASIERVPAATGHGGGSR